MANEDPFFGLKYIAWCRTTVKGEVLTEEHLIDYAKWQLCKSRNLLFNDPIFKEYTKEEILVEFFSIKFDEDEKLKEAFKLEMQGVNKSDLDWFEKMEKLYQEKAEEETKSSLGEDALPEEITDIF